MTDFSRRLIEIRREQVYQVGMRVILKRLRGAKLHES